MIKSGDLSSVDLAIGPQRGDQSRFFISALPIAALITMALMAVTFFYVERSEKQNLAAKGTYAVSRMMLAFERKIDKEWHWESSMSCPSSTTES